MRIDFYMEKFGLIAKHKIRVTVNNMIGIPGEYEEDFFGAGVTFAAGPWSLGKRTPGGGIYLVWGLALGFHLSRYRHPLGCPLCCRRISVCAYPRIESN